MTIEAAIENAVQEAVQRALAPLLLEIRQSRQTKTTTPAPSERLLNREQASTLLGISRRTLTAMSKNRNFPQPLRLAEKSYRWKESELMAWVEQQNYIGGHL